MIITLDRTIYSKDTTLGRWIMPGLSVYTLEDAVRGWGIKVPQHTAIPATGDYPYTVIISHSNRFNREMLMIYTEDNKYELIRSGIAFKGIRVHGGISHVNTWGCVLVGHNSNGKDKISTSAEGAVFNAVKAVLEKEEVFLQIRNLHG